MKNKIFTRNKIILITLAAIVVVGVAIGFRARKPPRQDSIESPIEGKLTIKFFGHASIALKYDDEWIYVDPVRGQVNAATQHKADYILITHEHPDHFNAATVEDLSTEKTIVIAAGGTEKALKGKHVIKFRPGDKYTTLTEEHPIEIEGIAAYNTTAGHLQYHPKQRGDCGYLLTIGGLRVYIAGDTEDTPEMLSLKDIDVAFLPINQPYTMTVAQAKRAIKTIKPKIFYPYHYGGPEGTTDLSQLKKSVSEITDFRYRDMD